MVIYLRLNFIARNPTTLAVDGNTRFVMHDEDKYSILMRLKRFEHIFSAPDWGGSRLPQKNEARWCQRALCKKSRPICQGRRFAKRRRTTVRFLGPWRLWKTSAMLKTVFVEDMFRNPDAVGSEFSWNLNLLWLWANHEWTWSIYCNGLGRNLRYWPWHAINVFFQKNYT